MKERKLNLQLFAEGGGSGAGEAGGSEAGIAEGTKGKGDSLDDVIYGKQNEGLIAEPQGDTSTPQKTKAQSFEELIKGDYKEEFNKKTQAIIDRRFKETKGLQEALQSHNSILSMLSDKYGVDASDIAALQKAIEDDESFYEQEAIEKGLTVEQLKEVKRLERENKAFREAEAEAERKAQSDQIYAKWIEEAENLKNKYGLTDFSLEQEALNPDFTRLLSSGISVESAYKAIHMDDMIGGAMMHTANQVKTQMANSIQSRQSRPSENATSPSSSQIFKTDVNSLSKKDRDEIDRRVMRGAIISF